MAAGPADQARLRWRCRRGVKELDVLMERLLRYHLPRFSAVELATFERLLDSSDPDLMDWILERSVPGDPAFLPLLSLLRDLRDTGQ